MADPYRAMDRMLAAALVEEPKKSRLVRHSGCQCRPPGTLWSWWHNVERHDKWICEHDTMWEFSGYNMWHLRGSTEPSSCEKT